MKEIQKVSQFVEELPAPINMTWGMGESDEDDILSVIFLASGFDVKLTE